MELKELTEKTMELLEIEEINEMSKKLFEIVTNNRNSIYEKFSDIVKDD